jgi:hypothetical protein
VKKNCSHGGIWKEVLNCILKLQRIGSVQRGARKDIAGESDVASNAYSVSQYKGQAGAFGNLWLPQLN